MIVSVLAFYAMYNGYRIVAIPGNISKFAFMLSGACFVVIMILFAFLGVMNINGFARFGTIEYTTSSVQTWWLIAILIESILWIANIVVFGLSYYGIYQYVFIAA